MSTALKEAGKFVLYSLIGAAIALAVYAVFAPKKVEPGNVGSGNLSLSTSVQKADICHVTATATTTLCVWQNTDQDLAKRVVTGVVFYSDSLTFPGTASIAVGTSSVATALSTSNLWGSTALTSSTAPGAAANTTFSPESKALWQYNEYVIASTTATVTTTGYIKILYDKVPTP